MHALKQPRLLTRPKLKDLLHDAMSNSDESNIWKVIQGLNGIPDTNSPNEAMSHNGRTITDIKTKAKIFVNHSTRVIKLNMSKANRDQKENSTLHLLKMKVVLQFKWVSCFLPLKR